MDSFLEDILKEIFSFIISIKDSLILLLHYLLMRDDHRWKFIVLNLWRELQGECFKDKHLLTAKVESRQSWFWFFKCFANDRAKLIRWNYDTVIIGCSIQYPFITGHGIRISNGKICIGTFVNSKLSGYGIQIEEDRK
jgi:hypothetical protein